MATVSSLSAPGVEVREYDNSLRISSNTGTTVFVPGYAAQGPVEEVLSISSINDFETIYGIPTNAAERYFYYTCLAILNNSGPGTTLLTSRLPYGAGEGDNVANAYTMLAYPAIPVVKNIDNKKGYDYWYSAKDSGIENIFALIIGNRIQTLDEPSSITTDIYQTDATIKPVEVNSEVVVFSKYSKDAAVKIRTVEFECGEIPSVFGYKDINGNLTAIPEANKPLLYWSINGVEKHSRCDLFTEVDENGKIYISVSSQLTDGENIYGQALFNLTYAKPVIPTPVMVDNKETDASKTAREEATKLADLYDCIFIRLQEDETFVRFNSLPEETAAVSLIPMKAYKEVTADSAYDVADADVTYIIGAPATYNVSLSEYYSIIAGEYFKWSNKPHSFDTDNGDFGGDMKETLGKSAFITINTSRATINDSYEGYYFGITDNLFNEPSDEYKLNSVNSVKFTSWNRTIKDNDSSVPGIVDNKSDKENPFTKIAPARLDFYLDSSNKGSISNILQTTVSAYDTSSADYDDTVNFGIFKLAKSTVGTESMKLTYSIVEKGNASLGKTRTYSTSNAVSPQNYFIESIVESSKNMTVMVNPYIAAKIKIDINGVLRGKVRFLSSKVIGNYAMYEQKYLASPVSYATLMSPELNKPFKNAKNNIDNWATLVSRIGAPIELLQSIATDKEAYDKFNVNDALYPFATYTVVKKNNKFIGSTPSKIKRALDLVANDEEYPDIDIIVEGGLSTIFAYSNNATNVISEGSSSMIYTEDEGDNSGSVNGEQNANTNVFNEDAILQGIEDLRTSRSSITDDAQKVVEDYLAVQEAFMSLANSFQNGGRGDTFYVADILRGILVRGRDTKVEKLYGTELANSVYADSTKVNHSWATSIYNPIKHIIESFTTSYASVYAQFVKILDASTNEKFWVPCSGYMTALMCASDQIQGPWYAGAGLNRGIVRGVLDCAINPNQKQRGDLYKICVNSVPKMANIGITNWGIRTLSKKASAFDQNTCRRTFLFIEKAVKKLLRYYLFEPNNSYTQLSIYNEIEPYMESIRNQGGIYSYQVVCNSSNNTPEIVNAGNLAVDISAAPTRTAEFIVLNMTANKYSSDIATSEFVG